MRESLILQLLARLRPCTLYFLPYVPLILSVERCDECPYSKGIFVELSGVTESHSPRVYHDGETGWRSPILYYKEDVPETTDCSDLTSSEV